jgi:phosphatidylinositol alpha 1,6-mannosyltransferase
MKVVHVSDCFLPRLGGIEIQVAELTRMQRRFGHHVEVVTATPDRDGRCAVGADVPVHRVVAPLPWELPVHPRAGRHVARLYSDLRPDVVHVHVGAVSPFGWAALRVAERHRLPTVVTVHSMWDPGTSAMYRALDLGAGWRDWRVVCTTVSEAAALPIRRVVRGRIPVQVVPNGVSTTHWRGPEPPGSDQAGSDPAGSDRAGSDPAGARPPEVHVVAVGRLAPRKQPLTLLRVLGAARAALGEEVRLRATVVGDGPALPFMERYLRWNAMTGWVRLAGRLDRAGVRAVLAEADVFLAPATRESFGIAALEARVAGVPVVAYDRGGVADFVVPEKEGLLARTPSELAAAVVRLARDRALRASIAAHNSATEPLRCTWPVVLAAFDELYAVAAKRALPDVP